MFYTNETAGSSFLLLHILHFLCHISHFFLSRISHFLSRISHSLSRISIFYLASCIFYLASRIFYLASRIFYLGSRIFYLVSPFYYLASRIFYLASSLSHKLLENFIKVAPKFFQSCLKLLDFSKKLLKSCSLSKIKMTPIFCLFLQDRCRWWSKIMQLKLLPSLLFFAIFFVNTTTAGDVDMYNCVMSFVFLQNQSTITFHTDRYWQRQTENLSLPYNNVFLTVFLLIL